MPSRAVEQYRLVSTMKAKFDGRCAIVDDHPIVKGKLVGRCKVAANPLKDLFGFACHICVADLEDR